MKNHRSRIRLSMDIDQDGVNRGYLQVPYSTNESAYGWIPVPIVSIRNGPGPRVLLVAGNHGDEYEGQIVLTKLIKELDPLSIQGQIIFLTAANYPAAMTGSRVSPLDNGNLNRAFPGDPNGVPTEMIADYIENTLLPQMDYVIDLHSGGYSLEYTPCTLVRRVADETQLQLLLNAVQQFGTAIGYVTDGGQGGSDRTLAAAAERKGVAAITAELGGGAMVSRQSLALAEQGTRRLLQTFGVLSDIEKTPINKCRLMEVNGPAYFVYATEAGVFEPYFDLRDSVKAEQVAGLIHFPGQPWKAAEAVYFEVSGTIICKRVPAQTKPGDCLYQLATDYQRQQQG